MDAQLDMIEGYMDGCKPFAIVPGPNRSASYKHGWQNGQDDLKGCPRTSAAMLREMAEKAIAKDAEPNPGHFPD